MRDDAARALRVDDDIPQRRAELRSVPSIDDAYADLRARASERNFERTSATERRFERMAREPGVADAVVTDPVAADPAVASRRRVEVDSGIARGSRGERGSGTARGSRFDRDAVATADILEEPVPAPRPREPVSLPRTAPGRSYGARRRVDGHHELVHFAGAQPGRRTVEITGQVQAPRRRSQTSSALVARPDRTALWAFLFALFLVLMAVVTAHGGG